jgi:hypothetical protein
VISVGGEIGGIGNTTIWTYQARCRSDAWDIVAMYSQFKAPDDRLAFIKLASVRIWLRASESTPGTRLTTNPDLAFPRKAESVPAVRLGR